jgi:hypothetical protein
VLLLDEPIELAGSDAVVPQLHRHVLGL